MKKYFGIYEYNEWEGEEHVMFFPYESTMMTEVQLYTLEAIVKRIRKFDDEFSHQIKEDRRNKEELENAIDIIDGLGSNYWEPLEIGEPMDISKLITCMVKIYYEMMDKEKDDPGYYCANNTKEANRIYKGRIISEFKMEV